MQVEIERVHVIGVPVDAVDMQLAMDFVDATIARGGPTGYIVAVNPEKVLAVRKSRELAEFIDGASLLIPDGIGVVLAARFLHGVGISRVPGADLMQVICRRSEEHRYRLFLYGASEEVNRDAVEELRRRYPGIMIVGRVHGFVPEDAMPTLVAQINESGADILFVALGSPRQEQWIRQFGPDLKVRLCMGIGGTLDTVVGKVKRAPKIWQKLGLEWLFRLLCQPSRAKRQVVLPLFVWHVLRERLVGPDRKRESRN